MKKEKDISIGGQKLILFYNDNETDPKLIDNINVHRLVEIILKPNLIMSEMEGNLFFDKHEKYCLNEMKKVVVQNKDFYKNFNVDYRLTGRGCNLSSSRHLISMYVQLKTTLKV